MLTPFFISVRNEAAVETAIELFCSGRLAGHHKRVMMAAILGGMSGIPAYAASHSVLLKYLEKGICKILQGFSIVGRLKGAGAIAYAGGDQAAGHFGCDRLHAPAMMPGECAVGSQVAGIAFEKMAKGLGAKGQLPVFFEPGIVVAVFGFSRLELLVHGGAEARDKHGEWITCRREAATVLEQLDCFLDGWAVAIPKGKDFFCLKHSGSAIGIFRGEVSAEEGNALTGFPGADAIALQTIHPDREIGSWHVEHVFPEVFVKDVGPSCRKVRDDYAAP